jgi:hypothetical protein
MNNDVGEVLKIISDRLKNNKVDDNISINPVKEYKHDGSADCLNCKHCIREEFYDGQWGMFKFDKKCSAGVFVIKDGRINPWDMSCDKFEHGNPKIDPMSEEGKRKY